MNISINYYNCVNHLSTNFNKLCFKLKAKINPQQKMDGMFYKIKDNNLRTKGYILGTVHESTEPGRLKLNTKILKSFIKSSKVVVEVDSLKLLAFKDEKSCRDFVNGRMDLELLYAAYRIGKSIQELETIEEQVEFLNKVASPEVIEKRTIAVRKSFNREELTQNEKESVAQLRLLEEAWIKGSEEELVNARKKSPKAVTDERDLPMSKKIDKLLQENKKIFIAIGTSHLVSDQGVISHLRKKGWSIVKISHTTYKHPLQKKIQKKFKSCVNFFRSFCQSKGCKRES